MKRLRVVAVLIVLVACGRHAAPDYFPLNTGQERTMRVYTQLVIGQDTTETTEVKVVERVRGRADLPGLGKCWVVESPRDSSRSMFSYFKKQDDGVVQLVPVSKTKPPVEVLFLSLPLDKGSKWYDTKLQREVTEVVARETVVVAAGTFPDCYEVVSKSTRTDWTLRQWLAPGVGPVKWENLASWIRKDGVKCSMDKRAELVSLRIPQKPATK